MIKTIFLSAILLVSNFSHAAVTVTIPTNPDEAGEMLEATGEWLKKVDKSIPDPILAKLLKLTVDQLLFEELAHAEFVTKRQTGLLPVSFPGEQLVIPIATVLGVAALKKAFQKKAPVMTPEELKLAEFKPENMRKFQSKLAQLQGEKSKLATELHLKMESLHTSTPGLNNEIIVSEVEELMVQSRLVITQEMSENIASLAAVDKEISQLVRPGLMKRVSSGFTTGLKWASYATYAWFGFELVRTSFGVYYLSFNTKDLYNWRVKLSAEIQQLRNELEEAGAFN